jgi:hypothetical protein
MDRDGIKWTKNEPKWTNNAKYLGSRRLLCNKHQNVLLKTENAVEQPSAYEHRETQRRKPRLQVVIKYLNGIQLGET